MAYKYWHLLLHSLFGIWQAFFRISSFLILNNNTIILILNNWGSFYSNSTENIYQFIQIICGKNPVRNSNSLVLFKMYYRKLFYVQILLYRDKSRKDRFQCTLEIIIVRTHSYEILQIYSQIIYNGCTNLGILFNRQTGAASRLVESCFVVRRTS